MFGEEEQLKEETKKGEPKKKLFATWTVGESTYNLKLSVSAIMTLEARYKTNLLNLIMGDIPPLNVMLDIIHKAMLKYHHGVKEKEVLDIYEEYIDEGGSQTNLFTEVVMPIYQCSGFFSKKMKENMDDSLEQMKNEL